MIFHDILIYFVTSNSCTFSRFFRLTFLKGRHVVSTPRRRLQRRARASVANVVAVDPNGAGVDVGTGTPGGATEHKTVVALKPAPRVASSKKNDITAKAIPKRFKSSLHHYWLFSKVIVGFHCFHIFLRLFGGNYTHA